MIFWNWHQTISWFIMNMWIPILLFRACFKNKSIRITCLINWYIIMIWLWLMTSHLFKHAKIIRGIIIIIDHWLVLKRWSFLKINWNIWNIYTFCSLGFFLFFFFYTLILYFLFFRYRLKNFLFLVLIIILLYFILFFI